MDFSMDRVEHIKKIKVLGKSREDAHSTLLHELPQQPTPFLPEQVGSCQTAIPTDHTQVGDAVLHKVVSCLQTSLMGAELFTAGTTNNSPALTGISVEEPS